MRPADSRVIRRRLDRLGANRIGGGVSPQDVLALRGVGFEPVGEVMGAVAIRSSVSGFFTYPNGGTNYPRGWQGSGTKPPPVFSSTGAARAPARITALRDGYRRALARLVTEVRARDGDGAVGVRVHHHPGETGELRWWEFVATGVAIRTIGVARARTPFTAALSAAQTASALRAGWVPVSFVSCPVSSVRWIDPDSTRQARRRAPNGELVAHTEAVNRARKDAAAEFARSVRALGADAGVVSTMSVELLPASGLAEAAATITGTALARFVLPPKRVDIRPVVPMDNPRV